MKKENSVICNVKWAVDESDALMYQKLFTSFQLAGH